MVRIVADLAADWRQMRWLTGNSDRRRDWSFDLSPALYGAFLSRSLVRAAHHFSFSPSSPSLFDLKARFFVPTRVSSRRRAQKLSRSSTCGLSPTAFDGAAVLGTVKAKPCGWSPKRRLALTAPARDGFGSGRRNGLSDRTKKLTKKERWAALLKLLDKKSPYKESSYCCSYIQQREGRPTR